MRKTCIYFLTTRNLRRRLNFLNVSIILFFANSNNVVIPLYIEGWVRKGEPVHEWTMGDPLWSHVGKVCSNSSIVVCFNLWSRDKYSRKEWSLYTLPSFLLRTLEPWTHVNFGDQNLAELLNSTRFLIFCKITIVSLIFMKNWWTFFFKLKLIWMQAGMSTGIWSYILKTCLYVIRLCRKVTSVWITNNFWYHPLFHLCYPSIYWQWY